MLKDVYKRQVRVYQYEKGFIHAKVLTIDGTVSSVGSANMDIRSCFMNNLQVGNGYIIFEGLAPDLAQGFGAAGGVGGAGAGRGPLHRHPAGRQRPAELHRAYRHHDGCLLYTSRCV